MASLEETTDRAGLFERRFKRERKAREEAERLLETKSLELFEAREETEKRRQFVSDAIRAMRDGFGIVDRESRILLWNSALLDQLQLPQDADLTGENIDTLFDRIAVPKGDGDIRQVHKSIGIGDAIQSQRTLEFTTTENRTLELSVGPASGFGQPVSIRDISARRQMERQLATSQKQEALGTMAGGIAHEINTPTQYIGDNLQFTQDCVTDMIEALEEISKEVDSSTLTSETMAKILKRIDFTYLKEEIPTAINHALDGTAQIARIVSAVRLYCHPSGNARELSDLASLIESVVVISRNEWKYSAILDLDIEDDLPMVPIVPDGIKQVLLNLIVNAVQAIRTLKQGDNHKIAVKVASSSKEVIISIDDSGPGVPDEQVERIFDPFFTTKAPGEGTGQGLAISQKIIVDEHNGRFEYNNSSLGGASFIISLPLAVTGSQ